MILRLLFKHMKGSSIWKWSC